MRTPDVNSHKPYGPPHLSSTALPPSVSCSEVKVESPIVILLLITTLYIDALVWKPCWVLSPPLLPLYITEVNKSSSKENVLLNINASRTICFDAQVRDALTIPQSYLNVFTLAFPCLYTWGHGTLMR